MKPKSILLNRTTKKSVFMFFNFIFINKSERVDKRSRGFEQIKRKKIRDDENYAK